MNVIFNFLAKLKLFL